MDGFGAYTHLLMRTEVWFRNPGLYIRQLAQYGETNIVWLRGELVKRRTEPVKYIKTHYGTTRQWRALVVATTGAHEYTQDSTDESDYKACYPVWQFGESFGILEALCADNIGNNMMAVTDPTIDAFYRPKFGQEHRVVLMDLPGASTGAGRRFFADAAELQETFPDCIIHVSGSWSYTAGFSFGLRSMDWDPHFFTGKNKLCLPNGRQIPVAGINPAVHGVWINVLGYQATQEQFKSLEDVLAFNMASAKWAGKYYLENLNFRILNNVSAGEFVPPPTQSNLTSTHHLPKKLDSDMVTCDTCSRKHNCKYYRADAICSVPGANVSELAKHFRTRDSEVIIEGLGALLALEADRIKEARETEVEDGTLNPDLTRAIDAAFKHGTNLAKLVDPSLRVPKLAVQINNGAAIGSGVNIQTMAAEAVKALEKKGIPRSEQTPEMVMKEIGAAPSVLEGRVVGDGS